MVSEQNEKAENLELSRLIKILGVLITYIRTPLMSGIRLVRNKDLSDAKCRGKGCGTFVLSQDVYKPANFRWAVIDFGRFELGFITSERRHAGSGLSCDKNSLKCSGNIKVDTPIFSVDNRMTQMYHHN